LSYDIDLVDPITKKVLELDEPHDITGGTYVLGGTKELSLNITWNYGVHYRRVFGEKGIRTIYGLTGEESIPILLNAIDKLGDDKDEDYWKPTEGNAKIALLHLVAFANLRHYGIWSGD
jgi:hypothetical protein